MDTRYSSFSGIIDCMQKDMKHVVAAFNLALIPSRRKLCGFLRYINERRMNWSLQFIRSPNSFTPSFVESFNERNIDGIAYSLSAENGVEAKLASLSIPTVVLDTFGDPALQERQTNLVIIKDDDNEIGCAAANHLLSLGTCRAYAFVGDINNPSWSRRRETVFTEELARHGHRVVRYSASRRLSYDIPRLAAWIARLPKPLGIFTAYDNRAVEILSACLEIKAKVPEEVAVIGVDNDELICANVTPPLTSIQPDHEQMGYLAAERLDRMMNSETISGRERICIGMKGIIIRESTTPISNAGRLVQRALAFISSNAEKPIKPKDVAAYLNVSRALADLRFRELQGESMGEAIRRARLEEFCRRLLVTKDTIANIASDCGFSKLSRLNTTFRKAYGQTIRDWRAAHR